MSNIIGEIIYTVTGGDILVSDGASFIPININNPFEDFKYAFDNDLSFKQEVLTYIASQQFNSELAIIKEGDI